jgi:arginine-tRNA-protein transferase
MHDKDHIESLVPPSTDYCMDDNLCSYIPGKRARMNYKQIDVVTQTFATAAIQRGWRRFGKNFVYPVCYGCTECKSLRIDVANFKYGKSKRKTINRNENTKIVIQNPSISKKHLELYNTYHAFKERLDGWPHHSMNMQEYYSNYVVGAHDFGKEILYYIDNKLVCVDLIDILEDGISSIYCYYDPNYPRNSLGTYSLLYQVKLAQSLGLDWVYLGYWVEGCDAFKYKENFKPLQILEGYPRIFEKPKWRAWTPPAQKQNS